VKIEHSNYQKYVTNMLRICDLTKKPEHIVSDYAQKYNFPLDIFQEHAISAIDQGHNVLVCAKTGSGKTLVGEYQIAHSLKQGKRVFYTTPIKSLSNQKFHDLRQMWPEPGAVGIMTGDIKFCPDAKIIIMTTEILRNLLYKRGSSTEHLGITANLSIQGLGAVIFDECHYINDRDRGKVWEETMILLPRDVQLILLSATLDKPEFFAEWLGELKQNPCHVIQTQFRVVPLTHYVMAGSQLLTMMDAKEEFYDKTYNDWLKGRLQAVKDHEEYQHKVANARRSGVEGAISGKTKVMSFNHQLNECINMLHDRELLPALCFNLSRKGCEQLAKRSERELLDSSDSALSHRIFDFHLRHHKESLENLPQYHTLRTLVAKGIAFHHSGVLPLLKEIVEILFTKGLIKLLYCTETFAVGINMPTKTVIFTGLSKFDDSTGGMRLLRTDEYTQMAGRAGRRGKDPLGTVIYLPEREPPTVAEMRVILKGGRPQITSRMDFHYDFLLKTFQSKESRWRKVQDLSYWHRQNKSMLESEKNGLIKLRTILDAVPLESTNRSELEEGELLEGQIKNLTNAKRKAAQRAYDRWKETHDSPMWSNAKKNLETIRSLERDCQTCESNIKSLSSNTGNAETWIKILQDTGLLEGDVLTTFGTVASEFNEGHPLLCAEFVRKGLYKTLSAEELLTVMASLINDKSDDAPSIDALEVPQAVKDAMMNLDSCAKVFTRAEHALGHYSPESYWVLSTKWVEPIWRWLHGENASIICSEHDLFEGNLVRCILQIANIAEEWNAVGAFMQDLELLDKLRDIQGKLVRDFIKSDSLYLHL